MRTTNCLQFADDQFNFAEDVDDINYITHENGLHIPQAGINNHYEKTEYFVLGANVHNLVLDLGSIASNQKACNGMVMSIVGLRRHFSGYCHKKRRGRPRRT